ncbi:YciI family protein [Micromonospora maritima]
MGLPREGVPGRVAGDAGHLAATAAGRASRLSGMEFLCFHRDRRDTLPLREALREEHWSYMDRFASGMIARGPTFTEDGGTPTGSLHIVDLPGPAAARAFAFDEPNYQAGVYRDVLLRRWRNTLGRRMGDFPGGPVGGNRYLVLALGAGRAVDLAVPPDTDRLIAYGPLLSDDGDTWLGTAMLVRAPHPEAARALLTVRRYADIEVRRWQFGGRR